MLVRFCVPADWRCFRSHPITLEEILPEFTYNWSFKRLFFVLSITIFILKLLKNKLIIFLLIIPKFNWPDASFVSKWYRVSMICSWCSLSKASSCRFWACVSFFFFFPKKTSKLCEAWEIFIIRMSHCHLGSFQSWCMWDLVEGNCLQFLCSIIAAAHTPNMFQNHAHPIFLCYTVQNAAVQFKLPP